MCQRQPNIDIGGQAAKTSKSEFRRGGISPPKGSSLTHVRNTATATAQAQVTKHIGKMAWPKTGLDLAKSSPAEPLEKNGLAQT